MELKCIADREGRLSSFLQGELKMSYGLMNKLNGAMPSGSMGCRRGRIIL